jgi:outer membrane protein assembly factor BamA
MKKLCNVVLILFFCCHAFAQQNDTTFIKSSIYAIPAAYYTPETRWAFGVSGAYYFQTNDLKKTSSLTANAFYTLNKQFSFNISPKIYFKNSDWYLYSNFSVAKYPDFFFGMGNKKSHTKTAYTSQYLNVMLQPQVELRKNFYIGGIFSFRYEKFDTYFSTFPHSTKLSGNAYHTSTFGSVQMWDKRNNLFYATNGWFLKLTGEIAWDKLLSSNTFYRTTIDFRYFQPVFKTHTIAAQGYFQGIFGNEVPFTLLSTLGGSDLMRGFRQGQFRNNASFVLQTEYRIPIYKRLKASIFASAGEVFGKYYEQEKLKIAFGAGLRYRLNKAGAHMRLDLAKDNYGNKPQVYFTVGEAF